MSDKPSKISKQIPKKKDEPSKKTKPTRPAQNIPSQSQAGDKWVKAVKA